MNYSNKSHTEKPVDAQYKVDNLTQDTTKSGNLGKNDETMTPKSLAGFPGIFIGSPNETNTASSIRAKITQGNSTSDVGAGYRDTMSTEGDIKASSDGEQGNAAVKPKKGKSKRFRKSKNQDHLNYSFDSTLESSSDEGDKIISRVHRSKHSATRIKPGTRMKKQEFTQLRSSDGAVSALKLKSKSAVEICSSGAPTENKVQAGVGEKSSPTRQLLSPQATQRITNVKKSITCHKESEAQQTEKLQDSLMHFASSDINPFFHQWQDDEASQRCYKNQVFGSAADLSSKSPLLNCCEKCMTRCCSVDNGLNGQNSPFNSHLSAYANNQALSSTLSSNEDYKEQVTATSQLTPCHRSSCVDHHIANLTINCDDSKTGVPRGVGSSSGQVDEIMLVYSSELESQANRSQTQSGGMCDHGTQTKCGLQTTLSNNVKCTNEPKRRECHKRSSTQVHVTKHTTEDIKQTTTWASLENMSAYLSQLIHSTSDLLGDVQGMRSGEIRKSSLRKNVSVSNVSDSHGYFKDLIKRDGSTQTVVDIGMQKEQPSTGGEKDTSVHHTPSIERCKSHEINVIVKVIGSEVLGASQEQDSISIVRAKGNTDERIQSVPDLMSAASFGVQKAVLQSENAPQKIPFVEKSIEYEKRLRSAFSRNSKQSVPEAVPLKNGGISETTCRLSKSACQENCKPSVRSSLSSGSRNQARYTDRASSPILTVEARVNTKQIGKQSTLCPVQDGKRDISHIKECLSLPYLDISKQSPSTSLRDKVQISRQHCSEIKSVETISLDNVSEMSCTSPKGSDRCSTSFSLSLDRSMDNDRRHASFEEKDNQPPNDKWLMTSLPVSQLRSRSCNGVSMLNHNASTFRLADGCKQKEKPKHDNTPSIRTQAMGYHLRPSDSGGNDVCIPTLISEREVHLQEDDTVSLAPSECNTDILLNIKPIADPLQHPDPQRVPDDLPMHNKFTNWSGIDQLLPNQCSKGSHKPANNLTNTRGEWDESESYGSNVEPVLQRERRAREIERLQQEREQVMATVNLSMNAPQLSVELTEAKLHYGLGETDTLLKMLSSRSREKAQPLPSIATKQQLYDRHRTSIEGLRQEREARLQTVRRARSLSPGKHPRSPLKDAGSFSGVSATPSCRKEYLQQLRREVMESTRIPDPATGEGHYPSEIDHLLRDYGRAREEARTEIARVRERLRERTEQEKRRLQQQALSQVIKDDLRYRTRISNSTLCTGSSLSISSGPTSGYNSGNTAQLRDGNRPALHNGQATVFHDEGLKVRTRPPICGPLTVKTQRAWLSAQGEEGLDWTVIHQIHPDLNTLEVAFKKKPLAYASFCE
ncbi:stAR-related lipid transfer protein 9-like isoform X2 [Lampris incognitus]|uniref:stAR-related lipid transfer protein 9-like isoform X2 n=1 Tax=Lampris incognitus TaxID=2546036 RepID=UPI0024B593A1|nr:stAR-related lipid transfer protein 9-like isoform X2 [Lampris incognitus]